MDSWAVLTNVGYAVEFLGLGVAAWGMGRSYKVNARRETRATAGVANVGGNAHGATGDESGGQPADVDQLKADIQNLANQQQNADDSLPGRMAIAQQDTERRWSEQTVKDLRLAIVGVAGAALGLAL